MNVVSPAAITAQPVNKALCAGDNTSFTASASGTTVHKWQVKPGNGFVNFSNGGVYSGATTATLTITGATAGMNGYQYRLLVSNATCTVPTISNNALLTVHALPTVGLSAAPLQSLLPGKTTTLTATPSANTAGSSSVATSWLFNGTVFSNTGNSYVVDVEHVGAYQVKIRETWTDGSVCNNQSPVVNIDASVSDKLFIFPSPNDGRFTVAYYNNGGASTQRRIVIVDSKGARVFDRQFPVTGSYTLLHIDLRAANTGIYYVIVGDARGNKLATGKVHVH